MTLAEVPIAIHTMRPDGRMQCVAVGMWDGYMFDEPFVGVGRPGYQRPGFDRVLEYNGGEFRRALAAAIAAEGSRL